jgi:5'-methylthioadenosine phosphorylase
VGSLKERLAPGQAVIPDQFIDRTRHRPDSFFGGGLVAHVSFAEPVCPALSRAFEQAASAAGLAARLGGTYVCMEGPQFSTRAESRLYRSWDADVVGMTNLTEAKLAREAEICYATLALVTDWDAWRESEEPVSVETVVTILGQNAAAARRTMREAVTRVAPDRDCRCRRALEFAILTDPAAIPRETRRLLEPLVGKYLAS